MELKRTTLNTRLQEVSRRLVDSGKYGADWSEVADATVVMEAITRISALEAEENMGEGTVPLTPENAISSHFAAQKELRDLYARLKRFENEFVRYSKRKYSDAEVLRPAVEKLLGYKIPTNTSATEL